MWSRPDFHLFSHLWKKRLISDQDLKELKGGHHYLTRPPFDHTVTPDPKGSRLRTRHIGSKTSITAWPRTKIKRDHVYTAGEDQNDRVGIPGPLDNLSAPTAWDAILPQETLDKGNTSIPIVPKLAPKTQTAHLDDYILPPLISGDGVSQKSTHEIDWHEVSNALCMKYCEEIQFHSLKGTAIARVSERMEELVDVFLKRLPEAVGLNQMGLVDRIRS